MGILDLDEARMPPDLKDALKALNWSYGRGEIVGFVDYHFSAGGGVGISDGGGTVLVQKQYGQERVKFRIVDGTLYFRGHQKKIKDLTYNKCPV